jgi:hypothetical protein
VRLLFSRTRQLGIGVLLGLVLAMSAVSIVTMRGQIRHMRFEAEVQQFKKDSFWEIALTFSKANAAFYMQQAGQALNVSAFIMELDNIRALLRDLKIFPSRGLNKRVSRRSRAKNAASGTPCTPWRRIG